MKKQGAQDWSNEEIETAIEGLRLEEGYSSQRYAPSHNMTTGLPKGEVETLKHLGYIDDAGNLTQEGRQALELL